MEMIGQTISQYRILEKIGEGGMGVVYKAQDVKLNRVVALKFMPAASQVNEEDRQRFLQEAQSAALLNHPNVCTIHDIKDEGEQHFIVMEFVDGQTLRKKIYGSADQRLDEKTAAAFAVQIGEALAEAHKHGIVHRDIKADNIMVNSRGQVKVMDFGLAKLKGSMKLTRDASTLGTLAYMAPEQVRGAEVDARSDIFSYGVLLFEMLTGRMPFRGEHDAAMMYSIMNEAPEAASKYSPDITPEVERIIERALEKEPEDRYQHMDDLVSELRRSQKKSSRITSPGSGVNVPVPDLTRRETVATAPEASGRGNAGTAAAGVPSSGIIPAAGGSGPASAGTARGDTMPGAGKKKFPLLPVSGLGALAVAAALYLLLFTGKGEKIDSLAVLPFVNVSGDQDVEYLTEGVTDYLTNKLSQMPGLRVLPSSFVAKYRGTDVSPETIGKELNVGAILTGRVMERNGKLSVQTELIDVGRVSQLWGERYERDLSGIQELQGDIVSNVTGRLGIELGSKEAANLVRGSTKNTEAYRLYLKGRYQWNKRTKEGVKAAVEYFQKAIDLDPSFALAYVGYAQSMIFPGSTGEPTMLRLPRMKAAAVRALQIDDGLAEAHAALGSYIVNYEHNWEKGEQEYRRAVELDPNYPTGLHWYAEYLCLTGRFDEGLAMYRRAVAADPLSPAISTDFGWGYYFAGRYDSAAAVLEQILKTDPEFDRTSDYLIPVYDAMGRYDDLYRMVRLSATKKESTGRELARIDSAWHASGRRGLAKLHLEQLMADTTEIDPEYITMGEMLTVMGMKDSAIAMIRKGVETRDSWWLGLGVKPTFDPLRGMPAFEEIIAETGLKEAEARAVASRSR